MKLTKQQNEFCKNLIIKNMSGASSFVEAGYPQKRPANRAFLLLETKEIQDRCFDLLRDIPQTEADILIYSINKFLKNYSKLDNSLFGKEKIMMIKKFMRRIKKISLEIEELIEQINELSGDDL